MNSNAHAAPSREMLIGFVDRSPALVLEHNREGWLGLFAPDAYIEDPVGTEPARVADGSLARFWDTFIAPRKIRFEVLRDHVIGLDVFRDVLIHTELSRGLNLVVPAYLIYQVTMQDEQFKVRRMAAYWSLPYMTSATMKMGPRSWIPMTRFFTHMIHVMGRSWVQKYLAAYWRGLGTNGLEFLKTLSSTVFRRDSQAFAALFESPSVIVEFGTTRTTAEQFLGTLPPGATLTFSNPIAAGWTVTARFQRQGPSPADGLVLLEFDRASRKLTTARFFPFTD